MNQTQILTIAANKSIAPTVKAIIAFEQELLALQVKQAAEADEAVKLSIDAKILDVQSKIDNAGIRRATDVERKNALQGITNADTRRALAPTYLNANGCWIEVPKKKVEKAEKNDAEVAAQPAKNVATKKAAPAKKVAAKKVAK